MMKSSMKKRIGTLSALALVFLLVLGLAACGGGARAERSFNVNDAIISEYAYVPTFINLPAVDHIHGSMAHGDRVLFYFVRHPQMEIEGEIDWDTFTPDPPDIVIVNVRADGTDQREIVIPGTSESVNVQGLHVTDEGHMAMIIENRTWGERGSETIVIYAVYDMDGNRILHQELAGVGTGDWFQVDHALFTNEGNIVLSGWADMGMVIYLIDGSGVLIDQIEADWMRGLTQTRDGRVMVLTSEMDGNRHVEVMREIDFETGDFGETFPGTVPNVRNLFPAGSDDPFDFIIDDGSHLLGYDMASGERTLLLNWIESELAADWGYHVGFLEDGRISVLTHEWRDRDDVRTELMVLTRVPRAELPEREIITLGGMWLHGEVRSQVVAFNRASQTYRIQVKDYAMYSTPDNWQGGLMRFTAELASGQGPDIVWGSPTDLGALLNQGMLVDLYGFIDADPELSRSDFFQNILGVLETPEGELPMIANSFSLQTMLGRAADVAHIQNWTIGEMLTLLEQMEDPTALLGQWVTAENFLRIMLMMDQDFINWAEGSANLNSAEFIHLLEIAARLPQDSDLEEMMQSNDFRAHESSFERMRRGAQLLDMAGIWQTHDIQMYMAALEDIRVLGVPTREGGAHLVSVNQGMGINRGSEHQDVAWDFVRRFLLPDSRVEWSFPLRIDQYDERIAEAMTPQFWYDEDGEPVEQSQGGIGVGDFMIEIYALTQAEADILRSIVEEASLLGQFNEQVMEMVQEEIPPFLAGDRSAADTARILQNRVQTFLNEQR